MAKHTLQIDGMKLLYDCRCSGNKLSEIEEAVYVCKGTISRARRTGRINTTTLKLIAGYLGYDWTRYTSEGKYEMLSDEEVELELERLTREYIRRRVKNEN